MAQQNIDFGSFPNDPSADAIRAAFQKIQTNFTELYNKSQSGTVQSVTAGAGLGQTKTTGDIVLVANIPNITIQTSDSLLVGVGVATGNKATVASYSTPFKLDLAPNITTSNARFSNTVTTGNLNVTNSVNSSLVPAVDGVYNLGSPTKRWKTLYLSANTLDMGGVAMGSDGTAITLGQLSVQSSIVSASVNSASVSSPTINVGNAVLTSTAGGTLQVTNMTVVNQFSTNNVVINNNLNVTNNITVTNIISQSANVGGTTIDSSGTITIKQAPISTLSGSSTGTNTSGVSTVTFGEQGYSPYIVGQTITIIGATPSAYNGVHTVTDCTSTSVSFEYTGTRPGPITIQGSITSGGTITIGGGGGVIQVGNTSIDQSGALSVGNTTITPSGAITTAPGAATPDFHAPGDDSQLLFNSGGNTAAISAVTYNTSTNLLSIAGNVQGSNLVSTGILSISLGATIGGTANVGNLISQGSANITGAANVGSLVSRGTANITGTANVGNLVSQGTANITGTANVGNLVTLGVANITGTANVGNLVTLGIANITGTANVGNLVTLGVANITGTANVGNLVTLGVANITGTANVGNLVTQGAANITGTANVGNLISQGIATVTGTANVGNLVSLGTASVAGNHYVTSSASVGGDQNIGTNINITSLTPSSPVTGNVRVTYTDQGYIPFTPSQTVTISGVTTTLAYNTTYSVYSATTTSAILTSTQTGTAGITIGVAKISGGGNLTMTGTHTAGSLVSLGNANVNGVANVGNLISQGTANVVGTANVGNLTTQGNATVAGVHYVGVSGTTVGSNVLVANGDARTVGTHFMATANITNGFTSGYHVIGTTAQSGSNLLTVNGSSYTSGVHYASNVNVTTNHIVGGNIVVGSTSVQSGNSLTVTGNSYVSSNHTIGGNSSTDGRHTINGNNVTGNVLVVTGNANVSGTHSMGNAIIAGTHTVSGAGNALTITNNANIGGTAYMNSGISGTHTITGTGNALTVTNNARIDGTAFIGTANLGNAIFTKGVVGSGDGNVNSVFTARGNVFISGIHYANSDSVTIGNHVVGNSTPVSGYVFTANGNTYTSTNHFVGGDSNVVGTHKMAYGISTTSHYVGSGSLLGSNVFGVNGSAYTIGTHLMTTGISTTSHYVGSGSLLGSNVFGVNGNSYINGTHSMVDGVSSNTHTINGTIGNALSVGGNAITVNTHYLGYGVTANTHYIGGGTGVTGNALIVSGSANFSGNHYISGFSTIGGGRYDINTQLSITGNSYTSGNHTTNNNHFVNNFFTAGGLTPNTISDGSGSGTYHMTVQGNGYVSQSHYVGGYSVIGGGTRKDSTTFLSVKGNAYTSSYHTMEYGVSNVQHYIGPSGTVIPSGTVLLANGNSYTVSNHITGANHTTVGTHLVGPTGTTVASDIKVHVVGNANTTGTHYMGNSSTIGSHTISGTGVTGNVLTVTGQSYTSTNHLVGGNIVVGGITQSGSNALTVTGSSSVSGNHTVSGNTTTGTLHTINVTNPYASPFGAIPSMIVAGQITSISFYNNVCTVVYSLQTMVPFTIGQIITISGVLNAPITINTNWKVTTCTTTQLTFDIVYPTSTYPTTFTIQSTNVSGAAITHVSTLSVQGIMTVQGNASLGNITAVSSVTGGVIKLSGDSTGNALIASGLVNIGGNHKIAGTHTIGSTGITVTGIASWVLGASTTTVTVSYSTQGVIPFVTGQIINLLNAGTSWNLTPSGFLNTNTDYVVTGTPTTTSVSFIIPGTSQATPPTGTFGVITSSPTWAAMQVNGGANISGNLFLGNSTNNITIFKDGNITATNGTFSAKTFTGTYANANLDGSTGYKFSALTGAPANVTSTSWGTATAGGSFTYDSTTATFNFKPALTYIAANITNASGNGGISLSGNTISYTPPVIPAAYSLPTASYGAAGTLGGIRVGKLLTINTDGTLDANVQVSSVAAGTGITVSGTGSGPYTGAVTVSIPQAIGTTNSVQFGSLTLGSVTGSSILLTVYGAIVAYDNITAYQTSDITFKENVRPIPDALPKVLNIGGKLFDWKDSYLTERGGEDDYFRRKQDFGVIANDVLKYFPEAVRTKPDGTLAVDYEKLSALAFQAIIEQEEKHKQDIKSLQDQIDTIMNLLKDKQ